VQALDEFMRQPRMVCLGDVVALEVKHTPVLGPMQTAEGGGGEDGQETSLVFMKVIELTTHTEWEAHRLDVRFRSSLLLAWLQAFCHRGLANVSKLWELVTTIGRRWPCKYFQSRMV
jgi:hypothetical protein